MNRKLRSSFASLGFLALLSTGCVKHINVLREAQGIFNRAAEADNRHQLNGTGPIDEASGGYALAQKMLEDLTRTKKGDLEKDNLLCTTLAIRALSLWRLGRHEDARTLAVSQEAQDCTSEQRAKQAPRDVALLVTVPALIRIDEANQILAEDRQTFDSAGSGAKLTDSDWQARTKRFDTIREKIYGAQNSVFANRGALCALQTAGSQAGNSPVINYLRMSMLAGIRVVHAATEIDLPVANNVRDNANNEARRRAAIVIMNLRNGSGFAGNPLARDVIAPAIGQSLRGWERLFGITDEEIAAAAKDKNSNFCQ